MTSNVIQKKYVNYVRRSFESSRNFQRFLNEIDKFKVAYTFRERFLPSCNERIFSVMTLLL